MLAAIDHSVKVMLVVAGVALAFLAAQLLAIRWRRRVGYRLPSRARATAMPSRDVRAFFPPWSQRLARLVVAPGRIEVDTYWRSTQLLTQTRGPVVEVCPRFGLPWRKRAFVIRDESSWCYVYGPGRTIRVVRKDLVEAGFEVEQEPTRFITFSRNPARYLRSLGPERPPAVVGPGYQ